MGLWLDGKGSQSDWRVRDRAFGQLFMFMMRWSSIAEIGLSGVEAFAGMKFLFVLGVCIASGDTSLVKRKIFSDNLFSLLQYRLWTA